MANSEIKDIFETEESLEHLKAELKDIISSENELALKMSKFKERFDRHEKDIYEWINTITQKYRDGKNGNWIGIKKKIKY